MSPVCPKCHSADTMLSEVIIKGDVWGCRRCNTMFIEMIKKEHIIIGEGLKVYICDGCGKKQDAGKNRYGDSVKPEGWYERQDKDGEQHACSRGCIEKISKQTGKTGVVAPL